MQQQTRKKKKKRKMRKGFKVFVLLVLFTGAAVTLMLSPFFNIKSFVVSGNSQVQTENIIAASGISLGTNAFRADYKKAQSAIYNLPYVASCKVSLSIPDKIKITITESSAAAYVPLDAAAGAAGKLVAVDEGGKTLEIVEPENRQELPVFLGFDLSNLTLGRHVSDDSAVTGEISSYLNSISQYGLTMVDTIDLTDRKNVVFTLKSGLMVYFGDQQNFGYNAAYLKETLNHIGENAQGKIDLRNTDNGVPYQAPKSPDASPTPSPESAPENSPQGPALPQQTGDAT